MKVQWNPVDTDTKGTCHSVRIIAGCPKKSHGYIFYRHKDTKQQWLKAKSWRSEFCLKVERKLSEGHSIFLRVKHRKIEELIKIPKHQTRHTLSLPVFSNKIVLTCRNLSFEHDAMYACLQLAHNQNGQWPDTQCPWGGVDNLGVCDSGLRAVWRPVESYYAG